VRRFARSSGVDLAGVHGTGAHGRITHQDVQRAADTTGSRRRVSPYARRRARELGVDPADLTALGAPGPVSAADVEAAAAARPDVTPPSAATRTAAPTAPAATAAAAAADRTAAMRRAIATLMARSKREIPHYYLTETFDLSAAQAWLRDHNAGRPVGDRLVMAALLAKATALAARQVPAVNGYWEDDAFRPAESVHLGIAVSLRGGGLVTPAIHDAADLALPDLMAALRDVVERARRGVLHRAELTDGTLTMTNLGERGAESVLGVIFPPQVALVGFGRVVERAVAVDGLVGARPTVRASLSGDHRAGDGHVGGTYLAAIGEMLERPEDL
jgi:pyruvate dehydrogenase E2 component (dihydrolipoamide acetyltransferase)